MKLFLTLIVSILTYFGLQYYQTGSLITWVVLVVLWTVIDYFTYNNPFSWKDYIILVVILSIVEIATLYNYFGTL
ncbi:MULTISPECIES: hypothetical protein [unclassified Tenacibaculum]|uniref:hypothetical protein n=1 Tax=unclassified Tenacibaculum TaxID=2635139 RepID=UPI001F36EE50|nr:MULTISPECIES: hypothetical protein [unclassified Tenacibaculum]MCF2873372.1 hypothetical protein [Tenacibaculum sp. Cn5-1]MCF2933528.1 hypothetical protein [Tenacibaculum sp. Cn5-34]MCG7509890.1 hypothetical protein [Tenacibaculum sp. Cn5-46]